MVYLTSVVLLYYSNGTSIGVFYALYQNSPLQVVFIFTKPYSSWFVNTNFCVQDSLSVYISELALIGVFFNYRHLLCLIPQSGTRYNVSQEVLLIYPNILQHFSCIYILLNRYILITAVAVYSQLHLVVSHCVTFQDVFLVNHVLYLQVYFVVCQLFG